MDAEYINGQFGHNQGVSMKSLKALFPSLVAGDLLRMPGHSSLSDAGTTLVVSVLRVDEHGGLYLSRPSVNDPVSLVDGAHSPFRWSDEKGALVDRHNTVPDWYTEAENILFESGGAKEAAARYAKIPRAEQLPCQLEEIEDAMGYFMVDSRYQVIADIVLGGEADDQAEQIALVLSVMGITLTDEQFVGLVWYLTCSMVVEADPYNAFDLFEP